MAITINTDVTLVGRAAEYEKMRNLLQSKESEFVAMFGRRRVGKTFLIKNVYHKEIVFHLTGKNKSTKKAQLQNFVDQRNQFFKGGDMLATPKNWNKAFHQLKELLGKPKKVKRVLFFDELPWLANSSADFLSEFEHFWNNWAIDNNVIVIICGSAASWIIKNVINDTGGLHNRVTQRMHLKPFTLYETEQFFEAKGINIPRQNIIQLYLAFGGIPYYLKEVQKGQSAIEAISKSCFGKGAALYGEFDNLYKALFKNCNRYIEIIRALATKWKGLTRQEIIDQTSFNTGGGLSEALEDLELSDFIQSYVPFGKKQRDAMYRLTDEYSLFYIRFIEPNKNQSDYWIKKFNLPAAQAWKGYAFETLCIKHIQGIKQALGITGIYTQQSSFNKRNDGETEGFQIDLLIDRADGAINICEMKYYDGAYNITANDIEHWKQRRNAFELATATKKQLFITLITADGIVENANAGLIDKHITKDALFSINSME
jgi:uncharacterized protein